MALPPNESLEREKRLLVCCAQTKVPAAIAEEIRCFVRPPLDWVFLFREAAKHSVTPLLCRQLSLVAADLLDRARLQHLKDITRSFGIRNLSLTAELFRITQQLASAGVDVISYKGPVLAAQAYGDLALREFEDLDIILRERDIAKANDVLIGLGYRPKFPCVLPATASASFAPAEYGYHNDGQGTLVELHTERTLRHFPLRADIDDLATRLASVSVGGQDLQTLSPEDTLLLLCIHGSKHFWERLSWIADISEFVRAHPRLDWDRTFRVARAMRANRILAIGMALALRLFDPPLAPDVLRRVRCDPQANSIAARLEQRLLFRASYEFGAFARFHLRRRMLEGALEGWRYSLRLATLPSDDDWSAMRLPLLLAPLHAAIRPFRLLHKYGATSGSALPRSIPSKKASN
jgi:hypothetical protein